MKKLALFLILFLAWTTQAWALTYYWVGNSGTWDNSSTTNWAVVSGGPGGFGPPTAADDVVFDANAGTAGTTLVCGTGAVGKTLDMTAYIRSVNCATDPTISGSITLGTGATYTVFDVIMNATGTLTSNGKPLRNFSVGAVSSTFTIADTLNVTGTLTFSSGGGNGGVLTFTNGITASIANMTCSGTTTRTINFGTGTTINFTGTGQLISCPAATVNITSNYGTAEFFITAGGQFNASSGSSIYRIVLPVGAGNPSVTLSTGTGSTIGTLEVSSCGKGILSIQSPSTTIGTDLILCGTNSSNLYTLQSSVAGTQRTLTKTSGTVTCDFCSIKDSDATGGATFTATNSVNGGNNTGWFGLPSLGGTLRTMTGMGK